MWIHRVFNLFGRFVPQSKRPNNCGSLWLMRLLDFFYSGQISSRNAPQRQHGNGKSRYIKKAEYKRK